MNGKTVLLRQSKLCSDSQMARNAQLSTSLHYFAFLNQYSALNIHYTLYICTLYILQCMIYTVYNILISTLVIVNGDHTLYILQCIIYIQYTHLNSLRMDIIHCTIVQLQIPHIYDLVGRSEHHREKELYAMARPTRSTLPKKCDNSHWICIKLLVVK